MPHVMFGGLVHEPALTLARRLAALLPGDLDRVFFSGVRLGRGRGRHEDGGAVLAQPRRAAAAPNSSRSRAAITATPRRDGGLRSGRGHARAVSRAAARAIIVDLPTRDASAARSTASWSGMPTRSPASSSSRWCRARAACVFHDAAVLRRLRAARRPLRSAADLRRDLHRLRPHRERCSPARRRASCPTSSRCRRR